ncbi:MAG: hypothetical protein IKN54_06695, partial [Lachnospiraceae bacterium]|nr:hypothetical protein [Lachnospiraceae bacterium]
FNDNNEPLDSEYQDVMSFNTLLMGGEEDYILVGEDAIQYFGNQKYYKDLSEIVDAEFIEENKDKIVYFDSGETGNAIPSGINITDTELVRDMVYTKEDIYLFFIEGSSHEKNDKMFLDYILKQ